MTSIFHSRHLAAWGCAALLAAGPAAAQKTYAVPESPAFTLLEVTPASVSRPSSARAFGTAVLNGISPSGEVKQGLALDMAPWTYLPGVRITLDEYQRNRMMYVLANTQLSLATVRAAGDTADTDLGLGLRITLFDQTDPMADTAYTNELRRRIQQRCPFDEDDFEDVDPAERRRCLATTTTEWRDTWRTERARWNGASLAVAFAGGWRFDESRVQASEWRGAAGWVTGGLPLGRNGLVLGQLRYDASEADDAEGLSYGGRAFFGSASFNAFVELVGDHRGPDAAGMNWTGGLEFRAAENLWLSTGLGQRDGPADDEARTVVIADLRWNLSDAPRLQLER